MAQTQFDASERGRVLANMFTLFNLAAMAGHSVLGYFASAGLMHAMAAFGIGIAVRYSLLVLISTRTQEEDFQKKAS